MAAGEAEAASTLRTRLRQLSIQVEEKDAELARVQSRMTSQVMCGGVLVLFF